MHLRTKIGLLGADDRGERDGKRLMEKHGDISLEEVCREAEIQVSKEDCRTVDQ